MSKKMEKGTENAIFLDGREYTAADLYRLIGLLVGNGVYANELAPTATNEDMSITHGAGHAWISGVAYRNTTPFVLEIATADGSLNRYDSLMLRLNLSINEVYAVIVQGAYATNPIPPACIRNAETFDLKLCDIYVPAGCTKITQNQITDTRLDSSVCGVPVFPVEHLDMSSFYRQINTDLVNFKNKEEADFAAWVEDQQNSNLATMAALVEVVHNTSTESEAEILNLLSQLHSLVKADTVGELITKINEKLPNAGGKLTGNLDMDGNKITGVANPTDNTDAANKGYVDNMVLSAIPKGVRVHTRQEDDVYTMTVTLDDGSVSVSVITVENGLPVKIVTDGVEMPLTWETVDTGEERSETVLFGENGTSAWVNRRTGATVTDTVLSGVANAYGAFGTYFYTQNKIDLTDYSSLKVNVTAASSSSCIAITDSLSESYTGLTKYVTFTEAGVAELDVSDYSGEYYVAVIAGGDTAGASFTADEVWLE